VTETSYRTCPLCEATCGLEITHQDGRVVRIRGDRDDVFSRGFICPKGSTLKHLQEDPDRLRSPLVKRDGQFVPVSWREAFAEIEARLLPIIEASGGNSVATYLGNPSAHNMASMFFGPLLRSIGTTNRYSASTVDQMPKQISAGLMFGTALSVPVPDIDRTSHLLMLGANPYASNGSLWTVPDAPGRIEAMQARGGKLVVVDPRRSKTAEVADEHLFIRPGTDAYFLFAIVNVLLDEDLVSLGAVGEWVDGLDEIRALAAAFTPESVAPVCGIDAATIRRTARELAAADSAAVYGRIGTCTQEFGTLASWLVDVLNVLTGNLDKPGGAMFTTPVAGGATTSGTPGRGRGVTLGKYRTRVSKLPGAFGELPVVALAEEILTPGDGQVRALVTVAGNPVLSTPNSAQLDTALSTLEFMVSVDIYVNETTRHADVILPPPGPLQRPHYDSALYQLAVRNVGNYSPATFPLDEGQLEEWEILAKLALIVQGAGADADPSVVDELVITTMVEGAIANPNSRIHGRDRDEILDALAGRRGPERILDLNLRVGPYGDAFGADPDGLSLDVLEANPHGVDRGPLVPRIPEVLRTPSGMIELAPPELVADVERLRAAHDRLADHDTFVLVGRRDLRSNNSWMHNVEVLVKGKRRCTMHVHPDDASRLGLTDGESAKVASRVHAVEVPVEITDAVMKGVVSIPHGWGHDVEGVELSVARRYAGVNANLLTDDQLFDAISGNAAVNGVPVTISPC
jgi:anaerobic selenocysteine-containing dehydrogenase